MDENKFNTIILDAENGRFLYYDYINKVACKYGLYDLHVLSTSDESFNTIILLKSDEDKIKANIELAEEYRENCALSTLENVDKQKEEKSSSNISYTKINSISLSETDEKQPTNYQINYQKTILQCNDDDDASDRVTYDDIIKLNDLLIPYQGDLDEDEFDEYNENNVNQKITYYANDEAQCIIPNDKKSDVLIRQETSKIIDTNAPPTSADSIIAILKDLSNRFTSFEKNLNDRLNITENKLNNFNKQLKGFEDNVNARLNKFEDTVNKRLCAMETNINLIYERQSVQSLLVLLNSTYLISSQRLETRTFNSTDSDSSLKFFRYFSNQFKDNYEHRWSEYANFVKKISFKPSSIEVNLLGFGRLNKSMNKKEKLYSINSPTIACSDNTSTDRSSYVTNFNRISDQPPTHILLFEGTTSPVYFDIDLFEKLATSSSSQFDKNLIYMKNLLRKFFQLERALFFLTFYYNVDLKQFFGGLICFHFYHKSHIDTTVLLKKIMSTSFVNAIPLLHRLHKFDQFILTY